MQKITILYILFLFFACKGADKPENKVEKVAQVFCECTKDLVAMNEKMMQGLKDTSIHLDFKLLQAENEKANECLTTVVAKYGKLKEHELNQVKTLVKMQCKELEKLNPAQLDNQLNETLGE
jgi:hypothetical protein